MADAVALVHLRSSELARVELLPGHLRHDRGARQEHGRPAAHDHEVVQGRPVGRPAGRRSADDRDLRHEAGQADVFAEDLPVTLQRREALLHTRAGRLHEPDQRHPRAAGQLHDLHERLRLDLPERASGERRVLGVAVDLPAVHAPVASEDAVARPGTVAHPARAGLRAHEPQRPWIGQDLEALECRQALVGPVHERQRGCRCARRLAPARSRPGRVDHRAHTPCRQRTELCPPKPKEFETAIGGLPLGTLSGRALPGT